MVQCSIACCTSSYRHEYKDNKMVFFSLPKQPTQKLYTKKYQQHRNSLNRIRTEQRKAWINVIQSTYKNNKEINDIDNNNIRICVKHFHSSVLNIDSNGKHTLKIGACPTLFLTKFSQSNEKFNENKNLCRLAGSSEDHQLIYNHQNDESEQKFGKNLQSTENSRLNRSKKRQYQNDKAEQINKKIYAENNKIKSIDHLYQNFPPVCKLWDVIFTKNCIKLRRILKTDDNFYSAFQEIMICENDDNKTYLFMSSTPKCIVGVDSDNHLINTIKYDHTKHFGLTTKTEVLSNIKLIEKHHSTLKIAPTDTINYKKVQFDLLQLSNAEKLNDNIEKSMFYDFMAEQIAMNNTTYNKRIYPENSFTMACALHLHNKSTHHYELLRKNLPFILLPDKRIFSEYNKNAFVSADCFFQNTAASPHGKLLRNICHKISFKNNLQEGIHQKRVMALHLDKINIQSWHIFRNKTSMFGPSHNDPEKLAKSM